MTTGYSTNSATKYVAIGILISISATVFGICLFINDGVFSYVLDDPYIHLALGENIRVGHYGVNSQEFSSPSSSILWPFLLAPFSNLPGYEFLPLLLNVFAICGTVILISGLMRRIGVGKWNGGGIFALFYPLLFLFVLNAIGLIFTGMEHALQMMLTLCVVVGLYDHLNEKRISWLLILGIVVGPLVRYENLAISLGALLLLAITGRFSRSVVFGMFVAVLVGGFSLFLLRLGLDPLPSSVLSKSALGAKPSSGFGESFLYVATHVLRVVKMYDPSAILLALWCLLPIRRLWRGGLTKTAKFLCWFALFCAGMHLIFGNYGWFGRYETYVYVVILSTELIAAAGTIEQRMIAQTPRRVMMKMGGIYILCLPQFWLFTLAVPLASANIRDQQYEMHRFVNEYHQDSVAVNDLGWVAFRNSNYVLDLYGLADGEARDLRKELFPEQLDAYAESLDGLVQGKDVPLAMIYDRWFDGAVPENWRKLGVLRMQNLNVVCGGDRVSFYACDPTQEAALREKLAEFIVTLPEGVYFELTEMEEKNPVAVLSPGPGN